MMKHRLSWLRQYWYWGIPVFYLVFLLLPKHYDVWEWGTLLFCILFAFGSGYCFADNEKPGMSECTYGIHAVCKFFNKKSVQIVEADSHISD